MTTKDAIKHLSWKISFAQQCSTHWADCVNVDALEIAVRAMAEGRKKGKWIAHNNLMYSPFDGSNENTCICNQCEAEAEKATNYCPSCGADMREKENE